MRSGFVALVGGIALIAMTCSASHAAAQDDLAPDAETAPQRLARLEAAAGNGDSEAIYELATLFEYGEGGVQVDQDRAMGLYRKAAEMGHGVAVVAVTNALFDSSSPYFDEAEGIRLLRRQMLSDTANGLDFRRTLAFRLFSTTTSLQDRAQALALLREGIALGDAFAMRDLAVLLIPSPDDDNALNAIRDPHQAIALYERFLVTPEGRDDFDGMAELARLHTENVIDGVDGETMAQAWITKSVAGGSALGQLYLGDFTFYGKAGQQYDFAVARAAWIKAGEINTAWDISDRIAMADAALAEDRTTTSARAMIELGRSYEFGINRPYDWNKARNWYQRGIDAGSTDRDAMAALASFYNLEGSPSKAAVLWRRLIVGNDEIAKDARESLTAYEATLTFSRPAAKPAAGSVPARPAQRPVAATHAPSGTEGGRRGAPTARQIRDALVYENTYGRVTGADALGLVQRQADYEAGISRVITMGISFDVKFAVADPHCTRGTQGAFACRYTLSMNNSMGFPYSGPGSHTFVFRNGIWRSPSYLRAIIESGNRSAANANNGKNCTVQGFGTAEGASIRDSNGLPC